MVSVDGSDFRIQEPSPFSKKWYSHKFHGPGLRYEVGVSVACGDIVSVNGPFPCGSFPDLRIFRSGMKKQLAKDELAIADGGYRDSGCRKSGENPAMTRLFSVIRARHEIMNRRMKHFNVLSHRFRHHRSLHSSCFHAVANLTQVSNESGERLFTINWNLEVSIRPVSCCTSLYCVKVYTVLWHTRNSPPLFCKRTNVVNNVEHWIQKQAIFDLKSGECSYM